MEERKISFDPTGAYVFVWVCLVILTATTVAVSKLHFTTFSVLVPIVIATVKAGLVLTFFMHLRHEPWILKIMLLAALGALALIVLLTFADVWYRY